FIIRSYFLRFYLHTWFDFLQAGDDNAIAGFQTVSDQPFIADRLRSSDLADFDFIAFPTTMTLASPRGVRVTPCCGTSRASGLIPSS
ncbi:hypothetical protein K16_19790, partial [Klebsiella pneumoniae]